MTSEEKLTLIEKLRKLKAKAEDASVTEEEAALYAGKVAELLQQYNLSESALDVDERVEDPMAEDFIQKSMCGDPWAYQLAYAVALLYFCELYMTQNGAKKRVVFVGRGHNVEVAKSMTDYLFNTIRKLATDYANSPKAKFDDWSWTFTRARNGFERGAGQRMYQRITAMRLEQTKAKPERNAKGNPANLPALYQDEAKIVKAFLHQAHPNLREGRGRGSDTSGGHAEHGRRAADSISLNTQISGKGSKTNLLR